jgi:hypothetical protein
MLPYIRKLKIVCPTETLLRTYYKNELPLTSIYRKDGGNILIRNVRNQKNILPPSSQVYLEDGERYVPPKHRFFL